MPEAWVYPVELRHEHGEVHAYAPALPEAIASGPTEADALREMHEAIAVAIRWRIKDGMDLPEPPRGRSQDRFRVELTARLAAKASVYAAWKRAGLSKVALGERIGRTETEVRRILDPDHGTKLDQMEEAAKALGGRLVVSFKTA